MSTGYILETEVVYNVTSPTQDCKNGLLEEVNFIIGEFKHDVIREMGNTLCTMDDMLIVKKVNIITRIIGNLEIVSFNCFFICQKI